MLWDTHMHTRFSGDSETPERVMADAAIKKGLDGICFTDHMDLDYPDLKDYFTLDFPAYFSTMEKIKKDYTNKLNICIGVELGLQPHLAARHQQLLADSPELDFVIGSSHVVHRKDPYYKEYFEGRTETSAYREYFESILENIIAFDGFDVYGHLDYVVRYGPNQNKDYSWMKYHDILDEILNALITRGKGIELNTGGFKYGLGQPNPALDILKRYRSLGGEIITLGSDAHEPDYIAYEFRQIPALLSEAGFTYFTVFHSRKPEFINIL